jgi:transposase-like protein
MTRRIKYAPEVRERIVRMVLDQQCEHDSQWAASVSISAKFGCAAETLIRVNWFNNRQLFEPIGNIPPVDLDELYYRSQAAEAEMARLTYRGLRKKRGGSV